MHLRTLHDISPIDFFQISVELLGSATFSSLMVFVATVMFASICLIVFVPGRNVWSSTLSYKSAVKSGEIVGNANTWALKLFFKLDNTSDLGKKEKTASVIFWYFVQLSFVKTSPYRDFYCLTPFDVLVAMYVSSWLEL